MTATSQNKRIVSRSEAGNWTEFGDADMKVLRPCAEEAVRFFRHRDTNSSKDQYRFSVMSEGRLVANRDSITPNSICRVLAMGVGRYVGKVSLLYVDFRKGREMSGEALIHVVNEVSIRDGFLTISGLDGTGTTVTYVYRIQDEPDSVPFWLFKDNPTDSVKPPIPYGDPRDTEHVRWVVVRGPEHWEQPETKEAEVPKPVEKPAVKKTTRTPSKTPKKGVTYEVRVNGAVQGSFSSKAKAESYKKELKAKGLPARIYGVRE